MRATLVLSGGIVCLLMAAVNGAFVILQFGRFWPVSLFMVALAAFVAGYAFRAWAFIREGWL